MDWFIFNNEILELIFSEILENQSDFLGQAPVLSESQVRKVLKYYTLIFKMQPTIGNLMEEKKNLYT